jgi:murein L,D-transpeptidase YcbB/YkuD
VLSQPVPPDTALATALSTLKAGSVVRRSDAQASVLQEIYRQNGLLPLWIRGGQIDPSALTVHARLRAATLHGLNPADYRVDWIGEQLAALRDAVSPAAADVIAGLDVAITLALLRYLADLHDGRAANRQVTGKWLSTPGFPEVGALLLAVTDPTRLEHFMDAAAPVYPMYGRLLKARATYEALIAAQREAPQQLVLAGKIEPGATSELLAPIAARLIELGDLAASATLESRYEGVLVDAVKRFQRRHGLADDGVVGKGTVAALQTGNRQRLRQIDLALERLRWLPPLVADRVIGINIPDFKLWAYGRDSADGGRMKLMLQSRVVVGKEGRNATPVFIAPLSAIDFSPYWNVPISIARGEILPRLRRDPRYLARQEMEFVAADGQTVSEEVTPARLAAVERGAMRIRQRPGLKNALGNVKFTMPNSMNIYLHDTPSRSLFAESRRDFSHGCIRVEEPLALAQWALADDPAWKETAIRQAMEGGKLRVVRLATPIPVVVFYTTATVDDDGTLRFLPDIYGYDRKLDRELPVAP